MSDLMIEAQKLTKRYGRGAAPAVSDVSFEVRRGEILGFLGPNGAGKTTTMKILTCFLAPTEGTARVNGHDVFEDSLEVRKAIGYLPESTPLYQEMLTYEYLDFMGRMRGYSREDVKKRIRSVVEAAGLEDVVGKEIRALSKGYRQRVGLAQALIHEPPILILDEPMSGLDPNQAAQMRELIRRIGEERTVILSTHNLAEVQVTCDRVLIISDGRIVADDTTEELRAKAGAARFVVSIGRETSDGKEVDPAEAGKTFAAVEGVESAEARPDDGGDFVFELVPEDEDRDLRGRISKAATEAGLVLVGLSKEAADLESVFQRLTTRSEEGDEAAPAKEGGSEEASDEPASEDEQEKAGAEDDEKKASAGESEGDDDEKAAASEDADGDDGANAKDGGEDDDEKKAGDEDTGDEKKGA